MTDVTWCPQQDGLIHIHFFEIPYYWIVSENSLWLLLLLMNIGYNCLLQQKIWIHKLHHVDQRILNGFCINNLYFFLLFLEKKNTNNNYTALVIAICSLVLLLLEISALVLSSAKDADGIISSKIINEDET